MSMRIPHERGKSRHDELDVAEMMLKYWGKHRQERGSESQLQEEYIPASYNQYSSILP